MFTYLPSPFPLRLQASKYDTHCSDGVQTGRRPTEDTRIPLSRPRFRPSVRWTIVLVPLALVFLTAYTHFSAHPAVLDLFSTDADHEWPTWTKAVDWSFHEPHKARSDHLVKRSAPNPLVARGTTTHAPMVPMDPTLPAPFPQPFDSTLSANFSTTSCYDFFLNMTQVDSFRACRPFSLLITTSHAFLTAQNDINSMNTDVWGTCNTDISQEQCDANMSWFASSLQSACQTDLVDQVAMVVTTLNALRAYDLMRNAACQVNPVTNSYCYVEAVASSDPSSYWFYELPLGLQLAPKITTDACHECTSGLMASYAAALSSANGTSLRGLSQTYNIAADTLNKVCGSTYAQNVQVANSSSAVNVGVPGTGWLVVLCVLFAGVLCGS